MTGKDILIGVAIGNGLILAFLMGVIIAKILVG